MMPVKYLSVSVKVTTENHVTGKPETFESVYMGEGLKVQFVERLKTFSRQEPGTCTYSHVSVGKTLSLHIDLDTPDMPL